MPSNPLTVRYQSLYGHKDSLDEAVNYALSQVPAPERNQLLSLLMLYHNTLFMTMHENLYDSFTQLAQLSPEEQHTLLWGNDTPEPEPVKDSEPVWTMGSVYMPDDVDAACTVGLNHQPSGGFSKIEVHDKDPAIARQIAQELCNFLNSHPAKGDQTNE